MKILVYRLHRENIYFLVSAISAIFFFLFFVYRNYYVLAFAVTMLIFLWKKPSYLLLIIIVLCLGLLIYKIRDSKPYWGIIKDRKLRVQFVNSMGPVVHYDGANIQLFTRDLYFRQNYLLVSGKIDVNDHNIYLSSQNIKAIMWRPTIQVLSNNQTIRELFFNWLESQYPDHPLLALLFLGIKVPQNPLLQTFQNMNISHLFAISGFHIGLLYFLILKLQCIVRIKKYVAHINTLVLVFCYVAILNFALPAVRAWLMIFGFIINRTILKKRFTNLEVFTLVLMFLFVINPHASASVAFQFSFLATLIILMINLNFRHKLLKILLVPLIINIALLPLVIFYFQTFSIWSLFYNIFYSTIFPFIYVFLLIFIWCPPVNLYLINAFYFLVTVGQSFNVVIAPATMVQKYLGLFYFLIPGTFIIHKLWFWFMDKKSI